MSNSSSAETGATRSPLRTPKRRSRSTSLQTRWLGVPYMPSRDGTTEPGRRTRS
jgi:hypothetical protein